MLEDTSMSPLHWRAHSWAQYSRSGLTNAEKREMITSLSLLITVWMQPSRLLASDMVYEALFPFIFTFVCKFAEGVPKHYPIIQVISENIQQYLTPGLTPGHTLEDQSLAGICTTDHNALSPAVLQVNPFHHNALSPAVLPGKSISLFKYLIHITLVCLWDCYGRQWWKPCWSWNKEQPLFQLCHCRKLSSPVNPCLILLGLLIGMGSSSLWVKTNQPSWTLVLSRMISSGILPHKSLNRSKCSPEVQSFTVSPLISGSHTPQSHGYCCPQPSHPWSVLLSLQVQGPAEYVPSSASWSSYQAVVINVLQKPRGLLVPWSVVLPACIGMFG